MTQFKIKFFKIFFFSIFLINFKATFLFAMPDHFCATKTQEEMLEHGYEFLSRNLEIYQRNINQEIAKEDQTFPLISYYLAGFFYVTFGVQTHLDEAKPFSQNLLNLFLEATPEKQLKEEAIEFLSSIIDFYNTGTENLRDDLKLFLEELFKKKEDRFYVSANAFVNLLYNKLNQCETQHLWLLLNYASSQQDTYLDLPVLMRQCGGSIFRRSLLPVPPLPFPDQPFEDDSSLITLQAVSGECDEVTILLPQTQSVLQCPVCLHKTSRKQHLEGHIATHTDKFVCLSCYDVFDSRGDLKEHILQEHNSEKVCKQCGKECRSVAYLGKHSRICIYDFSTALQCPLCSYKANKKQHLDNHIAIHTDKFVCLSCHDVFDSLDDLKEHILQEHNSEKTCKQCGKEYKNRLSSDGHFRNCIYGSNFFQCPLCSYDTSKKQNLESHIATHADKFVCLTCYAIFDSLDELQEHIVQEHNFEKVCKKCGKECRSAAYLEKHSKLCIYGSNSIQCPVCSYNTSTKKSLESHIVTHADKFVCLTCYKVLDSTDELQEHIEEKHDSEKICKQCGKEFRSAAYLEKHPSNCIYNSTNFLQCHLCSYKAGTRSMLARHMATHLGKFECFSCHNMFNSLDELEEHIEEEHNSEKICKQCGKECCDKISLAEHSSFCIYNY